MHPGLRHGRKQESHSYPRQLYITQFTAIGRPFWREAGVEHKIQLTIAPAADTLAKLVAAGEENTFDFAFIDADKVGIMH